MRDIDEQLQEIMKRADIIDEEHARKRAVVANGIAAAVCAALIVVVAILIPQLHAVSESVGDVQYGSLIVSAPYIGYVVIGILAFALGVFVTLLCFRLRRKNRM